MTCADYLPDLFQDHTCLCTQPKDGRQHGNVNMNSAEQGHQIELQMMQRPLHGSVAVDVFYFHS